MRSRGRFTYANVAATLALVLAVTSPAWGDPVANGAATLKQTATKALGLGKKANKTAKTANKTAKTALKTAKQALAQDAKPGPQGLQGLQGQQGQPGQNGATNVRSKVGAFGAACNTDGCTASAQVACDAGEVAIGGGGNALLAEDALVESVPLPIPSPNPTTWKVSVNDAPGGSDATATALASVVCASP